MEMSVSMNTYELRRLENVLTVEGPRPGGAINCLRRVLGALKAKQQLPNLQSVYIDD